MHPTFVRDDHMLCFFGTDSWSVRVAEGGRHSHNAGGASEAGNGGEGQAAGDDGGSVIRKKHRQTSDRVSAGG